MKTGLPVTGAKYFLIHHSALRFDRICGLLQFKKNNGGGR